MVHLIDKDALVAEIEKLRKSAYELYGRSQFGTAYNKVLEVIATLEVKEVDLEKEIQQHINDCLDIKFPTTDIKLIAKDVE